jgi:hypothetical protein
MPEVNNEQEEKNRKEKEKELKKEFEEQREATRLKEEEREKNLKFRKQPKFVTLLKKSLYNSTIGRIKYASNMIGTYVEHKRFDNAYNKVKRQVLRQKVGYMSEEKLRKKLKKLTNPKNKYSELAFNAIEDSFKREGNFLNHDGSEIQKAVAEVLTLEQKVQEGTMSEISLRSKLRTEFMERYKNPAVLKYFTAKIYDSETRENRVGKIDLYNSERQQREVTRNQYYDEFSQNKISTSTFLKKEQADLEKFPTQQENILRDIITFCETKELYDNPTDILIVNELLKDIKLFETNKITEKEFNQKINDLIDDYPDNAKFLNDYRAEVVYFEKNSASYLKNIEKDLVNGEINETEYRECLKNLLKDERPKFNRKVFEKLDESFERECQNLNLNEMLVVLNEQNSKYKTLNEETKRKILEKNIERFSTEDRELICEKIMDSFQEQRSQGKFPIKEFNEKRDEFLEKFPESLKFYQAQEMQTLDNEILFSKDALVNGEINEKEFREGMKEVYEEYGEEKVVVDELVGSFKRETHSNEKSFRNGLLDIIKEDRKHPLTHPLMEEVVNSTNRQWEVAFKVDPENANKVYENLLNLYKKNYPQQISSIEKASAPIISKIKTFEQKSEEKENNKTYDKNKNHNQTQGQAR